MNPSINQTRSAKRNRVYGYLVGIQNYLSSVSTENYIYPTEKKVLQSLSTVANELLNTWERKLPKIEKEK